MTITDIESLTYEQAKEIAIEMIMIKDHDCFFADLGENFGYSVLVFKKEDISILQMIMNYIMVTWLKQKGRNH